MAACASRLVGGDSPKVSLPTASMHEMSNIVVGMAQKDIHEGAGDETQVNAALSALWMSLFRKWWRSQGSLPEQQRFREQFIP